MSKYYRGLISSINDVKYKLQLASMTLKINENKNNITGIKMIYLVLIIFQIK